jgi:peptidoglycan/LPS O-acetylase OafA/YrhL
LDFFNLPVFESCLRQGHDATIGLLMVLLSPNAVLALYGAVPYAAHTWSIGTEEQFYLIWPWIVKKSRHRYWAFVGVIVGYNLVKLLLGLLQTPWPPAGNILRFWQYFNIDCMAIGAVGAYWVFHQKTAVLQWLYHRWVQWGAYAAVSLLIGFGVRFPHLHFEIYAVLFGIIIVNLATNPRSVLRLEYGWLSYLGKISYGIYMYHFLTIALAIKLLLALGCAADLWIYTGGIGFTICVAALSYHGFERHFLKMKKQWGRGY